MKRLNPVGSLPGYILTALLFFGLGLSLWYDRGLAFSPGPVSAINKEGVILQGFTSHADFEKQCVYCHEPLKTGLANKCKSCHVEVNQQILSNRGVHSQIDRVDDCSTCHAEHRGRDFNPTQTSYQLFDHASTRFSLNWHQENYNATPMQCFECHKNDEYKFIDDQACVDCHSNQDENFDNAHIQDFGSNCLECHDGLDRMQSFDHTQTGYPLAGKHEQIKCTGCHKAVDIKEIPRECKDCHSEPPLHQGLFQQMCDSCHTPNSWSSTIYNNQSFSHFETAGFSLELHKVDFNNTVITCSTCHSVDFQTLDIQTCINCHEEPDQTFMVEHQEQFGSDCVVCHNGVDRLSNFDHSDFFLLEGKHLSIECSDCHIGKTFRGTPVECWQCHVEPEIHSGVFGFKCFYCHSSETWSPASIRQHNFPLNHGLEDQSLQLECTTCHGAIFIEYTCFNCHDHQPEKITQSHLDLAIPENELPACINCHPAGTIEKDDESP